MQTGYCTIPRGVNHRLHGKWHPPELCKAQALTAVFHISTWTRLAVVAMTIERTEGDKSEQIDLIKKKKTRLE